MSVSWLEYNGSGMPDVEMIQPRRGFCMPVVGRVLLDRTGVTV